MPKLTALLEELLENKEIAKSLADKGVQINWDAVRDFDAYNAVNEKAAITQTVPVVDFDADNLDAGGSGLTDFHKLTDLDLRFAAYLKASFSDLYDGQTDEDWLNQAKDLVELI